MNQPNISVMSENKCIFIVCLLLMGNFIYALETCSPDVFPQGTKNEKLYHATKLTCDDGLVNFEFLLRTQEVDDYTWQDHATFVCDMERKVYNRIVDDSSTEHIGKVIYNNDNEFHCVDPNWSRCNHLKHNSLAFPSNPRANIPAVVVSLNDDNIDLLYCQHGIWYSRMSNSATLPPGYSQYNTAESSRTLDQTTTTSSAPSSTSFPVKPGSSEEKTIVRIFKIFDEAHERKNTQEMSTDDANSMTTFTESTPVKQKMYNPSFEAIKTKDHAINSNSLFSPVIIITIVLASILCILCAVLGMSCLWRHRRSLIGQRNRVSEMSAETGDTDRSATPWRTSESSTTPFKV